MRAAGLDHLGGARRRDLAALARSCASAAGRRAGRAPSATRCMSAAPTRRRSSRRSRRCAMRRASAGRAAEPSLEDVFIHLMDDGAQDNVSDGPAVVLVRAVLRDARQGIHPDAPRPADLRDDARRAADAARAVRLRDQLRPEAPARRGASRRPQRRMARTLRRGAARTAATSRVVRAACDRGRSRRHCSRAARCSSSSRSRRTSRATCVRGDRPVLLVEADATDPAATSNAIGGACRSSTRPR